MLFWPQQSQITTIDHLPRIAQQRHDGEALRGALPLVPAHLWHLEDHLSNLAMGRPGLPPIMGLQHAFGAQALLTRQALVGRNSPSMDHGKKSIDAIEADEPVLIERHDGHQCGGLGIQLQNLKAAIAAAIMKMMEAVLGGYDRSLGEDRRQGRVAECLW